MNVLWITNILLPEATSKLSGSKELKSSGGWMMGAANALSQQEDIELTIASVSNLVSKLEMVTGDNIKYFAIPLGSGNMKPNKDYEAYWKEVNEHVRPDIVHIHGTEFSHGLAYINACGAEKVVVSIQGLKSAYYYYYYYGLTRWEILINITLRDLLKGTAIREQLAYKKQSEYEIAVLKKVNHIIGRTTWDRARTWAINPDATYHFCNETLRDEFYDGSIWNYDVCNKHSIFVSQANYPLKGFHQLLKAMPLVLRQYPDATIRIAGADITKNNGVEGIKHFTSYGKIIRKMIYMNNLEDKVTFTGSLNAEEMKREYLSCNVFVCPSAIENSPNSLGEAQILGVPCVASYVGGIMDMMKGLEDYLYRFEEIEMLADKICYTFKNKNTNKNVTEVAAARHSIDKNRHDLLQIYKSII